MGVAKYVRLHGSWSIEFQEGFSADKLPEWFSDRKWHGIIGEVKNAAVAKVIRECGAPVVDVNGDLPDLGFPVVRSDDTLIGSMAADHLINCGFRQFAFCGLKGAGWSDLRRLGFERRVLEAGFFFHAFENSYSLPETNAANLDGHGIRFEHSLRNWLGSLPKPVGLMTCNDSLGWLALACCRALNVSVPNEMAVIGVDNDEIFCELSRIPLSSVIINARKIGYEAAALLDRLMDGRHPANPTLLLKPVGVAERRSTEALATNDPQLAKAIQLIREHACDGLDVSALLKEVPMSRRVFERHFTRVLGRTPKAEILRVRLKRVCQLLRESNMKLATIADKAGFQNPEHMCRLFKKKYQVSPGAFRAQAKVSP